MDKKRVFVDQPGWLGDIIFVMAIAQQYANSGHIVEYPIDDFPDHNKYHRKDILEDDKYIYLPFIANYEKNPAREHMRYKYEYLGFQLKMWRNVKITRDYNAEEKLIKKLKISSDEKFNLINANYSTCYKKVGQMSLTINNNYRNIHMSILGEYNIFDWIGVIERAATIHTIHTALHYILEILPNITSELHIYPRIKLNDSHERIKFLFEKNYIYH